MPEGGVSVAATPLDREPTTLPEAATYSGNTRTLVGLAQAAAGVQS